MRARRVVVHITTTIILIVGMMLGGCSGDEPRDAGPSNAATGTTGSTTTTSGDPETPEIRDAITKHNAFFVTQWGPTAFNSAGIPDGTDDCGPSALVMIAAARGAGPMPTPTSAEDAIRLMRARSHGADAARTSSPTYGPMMLTGLRASGLGAADLNLSLEIASSNIVEAHGAIDEALLNGKIIIAAGDPGNAWGRTLDTQHAYLHPYNVAVDKDVFGHWVVIFAVASSGHHYIVADPLSTKGVIAINGKQLDQYLIDGGRLHLSGAISVN